MVYADTGDYSRLVCPHINKSTSFKKGNQRRGISVRQEDKRIQVPAFLQNTFDVYGLQFN